MNTTMSRLKFTTDTEHKTIPLITNIGELVILAKINFPSARLGIKDND